MKLFFFFVQNYVLRNQTIGMTLSTVAKVCMFFFLCPQLSSIPGLEDVKAETQLLPTNLTNGHVPSLQADTESLTVSPQSDVSKLLPTVQLSVLFFIL